uniref:Vegetative cell wall protein gp1-like n=1 Tax=Callorhinus ursinus TaxID=34884 RepID=A0A3Q7MSP2_CALUR|nr:vegetative cell wall protein gp1-like [Callorhinus ursinus]
MCGGPREDPKGRVLSSPRAAAGGWHNRCPPRRLEGCGWRLSRPPLLCPVSLAPRGTGPAAASLEPWVPQFPGPASPLPPHPAVPGPAAEPAPRSPLRGSGPRNSGATRAALGDRRERARRFQGSEAAAAARTQTPRRPVPVPRRSTPPSWTVPTERGRHPVPPAAAPCAQPEATESRGPGPLPSPLALTAFLSSLPPSARPFSVPARGPPEPWGRARGSGARTPR